MNNSDRPAFAKMMVALGEYYEREISDGLISMYWQGLEHYDIFSVREALNRHMQNPDSGQWMPKIADIAKMLAGTSQDSALQAWAKVDKAVRHVGTYSDVAFDDPLIHRVIHDMGGWIALGMKRDDEWPFVAREFENRYRGHRMRSERPEYPGVLIGLTNAHNMKAGFQQEPARLIGNPEQAGRVMLGGTYAPLIGMARADAHQATSGLRLVSNKEDVA